MSDSKTDEWGSTKIKIPYYDPEKPGLSPRAWLAYVELARKSTGLKDVEYEEKKGGEGADKDLIVKKKKKVSNWTDEQTCTNAMIMLQGEAARWIENILEKQLEEMRSWAKFKKSFKDRFVRALTLTEKLSLRDLKMTSTESCRAFYDRCTNNMNLFYDDEWETLTVGATSEAFPKIGVVSEDHKEMSAEAFEKARNMELKLAFASGLREAIKKQVLFQDTTTMATILSVAQRVESGLKEIKKADIAGVNLDKSDTEDDVNVGAVNFKKKKGQFNNNNNNKGGGKKGGQGGLHCFYCLKPGHFKQKCMTRANDQKKGIYRSNINSPQKKAKVGSVDADEEEESEEDEGGLQNCQVDLSQFLNLHSA